MSKRIKYTSEKKYEILKEHEDGIKTVREIMSEYEISVFSFYDWRNKYEKYGIKGLIESKTWKKYSKDLKENAVRDYLSGMYSTYEIINKYEISTTRTLRDWIKKYNSHIELKDTGKGMSAIMTKGRNTTLEERIEIAEFCIDNELDYQKTSEKYNVSYQQVYTWSKKYEDGGKESLKDRRGKKKVKEELSPENEMELKIKKLEAENQKLKAENLLLKKLDEIERRRS